LIFYLIKNQYEKDILQSREQITGDYYGTFHIEIILLLLDEVRSSILTRL
jgi:hypothetical protein